MRSLQLFLIRQLLAKKLPLVNVKNTRTTIAYCTHENPSIAVLVARYKILWGFYKPIAVTKRLLRSSSLGTLNGANCVARTEHEATKTCGISHYYTKQYYTKSKFELNTVRWDFCSWLARTNLLEVWMLSLVLLKSSGQ